MDYSAVEITRFAAHGVLYAWLMVLSLRVVSERLPRAWRNGGGDGYLKDVFLGVLGLFGIAVTSLFVFGY